MRIQPAVDYASIFADSLARVTSPEHRDQFLDGFYGRFIGSDPVVAEKFRETDLAHQKEMLAESLGEMYDFFRTHRSNPYLLTLARIHGSRGRDIPGFMFTAWLDSLVETVRDTDPKCDMNVELAWRIAMAPGIEFMKFHRDH